MGFFSSLWKGVKKVFSKVVEVGKKIIKSPIGQIALIAAGAYFLAPAIIGATAAGGAATAGAGAAGAASGGFLSTIGSAIGGAATAVATGAKAIFSTLIGTSATPAVAATATKAAIPAVAGTGLLGFASAHPMLASTALNVGGQMVSGYAQGKQMEKNQEREERMIEEAQQRDERLSKEARDRQTYFGVRGDGTGAPIQLESLLDDFNYKLKNSNRIRTI